MHEIFLLGAGFSKAINPSMPLMHELTEKIYSYDDFKKYKHIGNIEELLSFLSNGLPWENDAFTYRKKADFIDLSRGVGAIVSEHQSKFDVSPNATAIKFGNYLHKTKAHIITLNYDTLLEIAIEQAAKMTGEIIHREDMLPITLSTAATRSGVAFLSGTPLATATLYKLHGSLSFYYSGSEKFFGENILLGPTPSNLPGDMTALKDLGDKLPLIVPPTFDKSSFFNNETIRAFWKLAKGALCNAELLTVIGYSLPTSDLMMKYFLKENGCKIRKIRIIDPNKFVVDRFRELGLHDSVEFMHFDGNDAFDKFVSNELTSDLY